MLDRKDSFFSMLIIGGLFFIFGFITWVNSILIPYFKIACQLSNFQSYLVAFAFYISYFVLSVPSAYLLRVLGFKKGIITGLWIMAAGAFIFIPAALTRRYEVFLLGLFTIGSGLAILQSAVNPYITILGPKEKAARRISFMGICNKGAGILAPLVFASVVLKVTDSDLFRQLPLMNIAERNAALDQLIRRVVLPYAVVGTVLFVLGALIRWSPLPEIDEGQESPEAGGVDPARKNIFQFPHLILGALAIFLHVGTQVIAIDTIIGYADSMHIPLMEARSFPSYTLLATIAGYLAGIMLIPRYIRQVNIFRICTLLGIVFTLLIIFLHGSVDFLGHVADISIWFVVLLGLANSLIWAGIWPLALEGLGRFTKLGASVMIMGLCGSAILPLVYGHYADVSGVRAAYWVLFPCYLYLAFYAFYGHGIRRWLPSAGYLPRPLAGFGGYAICSELGMEQMKANGLKVVQIDYSDVSIPESVQQTRPLVYKDGGDYCCVLGPDPHTGVFGRGSTVKEALEDFDRHFKELAAHPVPGDPVSEFIQQRHI